MLEHSRSHCGTVIKLQFSMAMKMKDFSRIWFFLFIFFFSASSAYKPVVPRRLVQDFSHEEFAKVVAMTRQLMVNGSSTELQGFLFQLKQIVYKRRLAKCIRILGSKPICENNVRFYIWAQKLAKKIMAGESI